METAGNAMPVPPSAPQQSRPTMLSPRHTHSRRKELKQLFAEHHTLTRAEVIRLLGCSPGTATEDLRALAAEGVIRRIETSNHLRTSYFTWIGA